MKCQAKKCRREGSMIVGKVGKQWHLCPDHARRYIEWFCEEAKKKRATVSDGLG
jgi:hypothetical protein